MTACLFAPSILNLTTPKFLLVFAGISYALFPMGFLFFNTYFYYFSGALIGAGTAGKSFQVKKSIQYRFSSVLFGNGKLSIGPLNSGDYRDKCVIFLVGIMFLVSGCTRNAPRHQNCAKEIFKFRKNINFEFS